MIRRIRHHEDMDSLREPMARDRLPTSTRAAGLVGSTLSRVISSSHEFRYVGILVDSASRATKGESMDSDHYDWHPEADGQEWVGDGRLPTVAFGHAFTHIPEHVRQDLETLERECAVYADHWIDELGDFRHVRISFTPGERDEFARRSWAYELFLRAGVTWASEVPRIDKDVAHDADTYSLLHGDGSKIEPPCHCFAAFLGPDLEALVCLRSERETIISLKGQEAALFEVRQAFRALTATIRSFNKREKGLNPWTITCEDDVRDLLYVMLRPRIFDLAKEVAVPSKAGSYKIVDLCSNAVPFLLEVKWVGHNGTWKKKIDEIYVDIQTYVTHPASRTIFFLIVDDARDIPDPRQLEQRLTAPQTVDGTEIDIVLFVCGT